MLEGISSNDLAHLARDLRAMDKDFSNAVQRELREPVRRATSDLKFSARTLLPDYIAADAASGIRSSTSFKGYYVKREANSRFTQHGYTDVRGKLRHPLYGNRDYWFDTSISGRGWWTGMAERVIPRAMDEFSEALWNIVQRIATGNFSTVKVGRGTRLAP